MTEQFQRVRPCVATGAVKGITLVSSEFAKAPGAPAEGSGWPVKKSRGARGGQLTATTGYRDFPFGQYLSIPRIDPRLEAAAAQRTDCTSTGGLVALIGAGPDTNRSTGLHSGLVVARWRDCWLFEFICCRSDLCDASSDACLQGTNSAYLRSLQATAAVTGTTDT